VEMDFLCFETSPQRRPPLTPLLLRGEFSSQKSPFSTGEGVGG